jgi:hypothetical protein
MPWLKGTAVLAGVACALLVGVGGVAAQPTAPVRVVLLQDPADPPPESLVQALRIQLSGLSGLEPLALEPGARPREQAERVAREPATLAVLWLPEGTGPGRDREVTELHALAESAPGESAPGESAPATSALREQLVRVPGGPRPDVERSLALKIRELVDALRRSRARASAAAPAEASVTSDALPPAAETSTLGPTLALGARVAPLSGRAQWGGTLAGGAAWRSHALRLLGALELAWFPEVELSRGASQARVSELAPGLFARAEVRRGALWLGAHGGLSLSFVHAEGSDGRERAATRVQLMSVLGGLHLELAITEGLGLYAGLDLQVQRRRQRFTVDGAELVDFGRLRPLASLALAWSSPAVR